MSGQHIPPKEEALVVEIDTENMKEIRKYVHSANKKEKVQAIIKMKAVLKE